MNLPWWGAALPAWVRKEQSLLFTCLWSDFCHLQVGVCVLQLLRQYTKAGTEFWADCQLPAFHLIPSMLQADTLTTPNDAALVSLGTSPSSAYISEKNHLRARRCKLYPSEALPGLSCKLRTEVSFGSCFWWRLRRWCGPMVGPLWSAAPRCPGSCDFQEILYSVVFWVC